MKRILVIVFLSACSSLSVDAYKPAANANRDTIKAQLLSRHAAEIMYTAKDEAESLLIEALTADAFFGPAHNNLGVLYLSQGKLYEAATEFEWARKLMPGHPDPRMNLALTLEQAGQLDEANQAYQTALEVYPGHIPTEQALARLFISRGEKPDQLSGLLKNISVRGESTRWRDWAKKCLAVGMDVSRED